MQDPVELLKAKRWQELRRADRARSAEDITAQVEREFKFVPTAPAAAPAESTATPRPAADTTRTAPAAAAPPQPVMRAARPKPMEGFAPESTSMTGAPVRPSGLTGGETAAGAMRSLLQGVTFQNWDEIEAGVNAALDPELTYRNYRDAIREQDAEFRKAHPVAAGTLELGGAILPSAAALIASGGTAAPGVAARATPLLGRAIQGATAGAGYGALQGIGAAPELKDVPEGVVTGGLIGGTIGGGIPVVGQAGRALLGGAGNMAESAVRSTAMGTGAAASAAQRLMPMADRRAQRRAVQNILQRLQEDGLTPQQAADQLRSMTVRGTPAAVADVGGRNMLELANRPNLLGGEGREIMGNLAESRVAGSAERIATAANKNARTLRGNVNQMVRDIAERRKEPAAKLYDAAFAHGDVTLDSRGTALLMSADGQRAWNEGMRRSLLEFGPGSLRRLQPLFGEITDEAGAKRFGMLRSPTVQDVDYVKRGFDASIRIAQKQEDADLVRVLTKAKNELLAQVDAQAPAYAEARAFWGGEEGLMDALEAGKRILRGGADDFEDAVNALNPDELEMFRTGAVNAIREQLERRDGSVNAVRFMSDPTVIARLKRVFPDPVSFERLQSVVGDEARLAAVRNRLTNQSATAKNLGEMADEMFSSTYTGGNPVTNLTFSTLGSVRDAATRQARSASTDALARLLSQQGEGGAKFLEGLDDIARGVMARNAARQSAGARTAGYLGGATVRGGNTASAMGIAPAAALFNRALPSSSDSTAAPSDSLERYLQETADLITQEEGWRQRAYEDTGGVPTIGFGRTGRDVRPGMSTTLEAEQEWLKKRLRDDAEYLQSQGITPLPELLSATYNLGRRGFERTGAGEAFKAGDYAAAGDSLVANGEMAWNKKTKRYEPLLLGRRQRERESLIRRQPTPLDLLNR